MSEARTLRDVLIRAGLGNVFPADSRATIDDADTVAGISLDAPIIGNASAGPAVLAGDVQDLYDIMNDELPYAKAADRVRALRAILSACRIAVPEGYGTVHREREVLHTEFGPYEGGIKLTLVCHEGFVPRNGHSIAFLARHKPAPDAGKKEE